MKNKVLTVSTITKVAILSAIAFVLMFFQISLPFIAPPFYQLDFSEVAVLVGGFALGPLPGVMIEFFKNFLQVLFTGTSTAFVGDISNFLVGCAFVVPASIYYQKHKTKKGAMIGMLIATISMTLVAFITNYFFIIPAYVFFMGMDLDTIVGMGQAIFGFVDSKFMLVLCCTTPFNLIKGIVVSLVTTLIYKHISPLLHR